MQIGRQSTSVFLFISLLHLVTSDSAKNERQDEQIDSIQLPTNAESVRVENVKSTNQSNLIAENQSKRNQVTTVKKAATVNGEPDRLQKNAVVMSSLEIEFNEQENSDKVLISHWANIERNQTIIRNDFDMNEKSLEKISFPCQDGFQFNLTSKKCEDVDECSMVSKEPLCDHECNNRIGSYECTCPSGYDLVNGDCVDIDECSDAIDEKGGVCLLPDNHSQSNQSNRLPISPLDPHQMPLCLNLRGNYRCARIICPAGFLMMDSRKCILTSGTAKSVLAYAFDSLAISSHLNANNQIGVELFHIDWQSNSNRIKISRVWEINENRPKSDDEMVIWMEDNRPSKPQEKNWDKTFQIRHDREVGQAKVYLIEPIQGPKVFRIECDIHIDSSQRRNQIVRTIFYLFVSEYSF